MYLKLGVAIGSGVVPMGACREAGEEQWPEGWWWLDVSCLFVPVVEPLLVGSEVGMSMWQIQRGDWRDWDQVARG